jgi:mycofactocin system transcriptional regulator
VDRKDYRIECHNATGDLHTAGDDLRVRSVAAGRPPRTTHAQVSRVALELFARNGFEETTVEDIAARLGVGRRTLFRYFPSKNDMVWGDFHWVLDRLRADLAVADPDEPLMEALTRAVVASNTYADEQLPELRIRMSLITSVPALQAHSMLRYEAWRGVVADFAGRRLDVAPTHLLPQTLGFAALGASMSAFVAWVADPDSDLRTNLEQSYALLGSGFALATPHA